MIFTSYITKLSASEHEGHLVKICWVSSSLQGTCLPIMHCLKESSRQPRVCVHTFRFMFAGRRSHRKRTLCVESATLPATMSLRTLTTRMNPDVKSHTSPRAILVVCTYFIDSLMSSLSAHCHLVDQFPNLFIYAKPQMLGVKYIFQFITYI